MATTSDVSEAAHKAQSKYTATSKQKGKGKKPAVKPLPGRTVTALNKWKVQVTTQFRGIDDSPLAQIEIDRFFYLLRKLKEIECGCYTTPPPWFVERAWGTELRSLFTSLRDQVHRAQARTQTRDVLWKQVGMLLVQEIKDPEVLGKILSRLEQIHAGNYVEVAIPEGKPEGLEAPGEAAVALLSSPETEADDQAELEAAAEAAKEELAAEQQDLEQEPEQESDDAE